MGLYSCSPKSTSVEQKLSEKPEASRFDQFGESQFSLIGDIQPFKSEILIDTLDDHNT